MKIAVFNHKGGVGKSTLTSHIAFRAIERNYPLAVMDIDRQRNTMAWLSKHTSTNNYTEPFNIGSVYVTKFIEELETIKTDVIFDCPPSYDVVEQIKDTIDVWIIPVDGRFSVDGAVNVLSELPKNSRAIVVSNKSYDSKFGNSEMLQIKKLPCEIYFTPLPTQDVVRKAEMLGVPAWKVPYGLRSMAAQNLVMFADWVIDGIRSNQTYNFNPQPLLRA